MKEIEDGVYFHYCSLDTLISILKNCSIRLGNPYKMNDSKEVKYFFERMCMIGKKYADEQKSEELKRRYKYFYVEGVSTVYEAEFTSKEVPHIMCLSKNEDLLSQWRGYAADGYGVAIGFDIEEILNVSKVLKAIEVIYSEKECDEMINSILGEFGISNPKVIEFNRMGDMYAEVSGLIEEAITEAIGYKNAAFYEEQEIRLIYIESDLSDTQIQGPFYRTDGKRLISFYELSLEKIKNRCIKKILIGPKSEISSDDIINLLKAYGFNDACRIEKSKATYI